MVSMCFLLVHGMIDWRMLFLRALSKVMMDSKWSKKKTRSLAYKQRVTSKRNGIDWGYEMVTIILCNTCKHFGQTCIDYEHIALLSDIYHFLASWSRLWRI